MPTTTSLLPPCKNHLVWRFGDQYHLCIIETWEKNYFLHTWDQLLFISSRDMKHENLDPGEKKLQRFCIWNELHHQTIKTSLTWINVTILIPAGTIDLAQAVRETILLDDQSQGTLSITHFGRVRMSKWFFSNFKTICIIWLYNWVIRWPIQVYRAFCKSSKQYSW